MTQLVADTSGHGPVVVLLHGQPGSRGDWAPVTQRLEEHFLVVAPDRPGYGQTGGRARGLRGNAAAVVSLLDRLGVAKATIVGYSWAGGVALALAQDAPERVAGLVLVSSVSPAEPVTRLDRMLAMPPIGTAVTVAGLLLASSALSIPPVRRALHRRQGYTTATCVVDPNATDGSDAGSWDSATASVVETLATGAVETIASSMAADPGAGGPGADDRDAGPGAVRGSPGADDRDAGPGAVRASDGNDRRGPDSAGPDPDAIDGRGSGSAGPDPGNGHRGTVVPGARPARSRPWSGAGDSGTGAGDNGRGAGGNGRGASDNGKGGGNSGRGGLWAGSANGDADGRAVRARAQGPKGGRLVDGAGPVTVLYSWRTNRVWRSFVTEQRSLIDELPLLAAGLAAIDVPTVVLVGEADRVVPPAAGRGLARTIPGARLIEVGGAGHLLAYQHPDAVAAAIREVTPR
jgi:pimeloyl-ACP methyl ester carboxylesterase